MDYSKFGYLSGRFYRITFYHKNPVPVSIERPYEEVLKYYDSIQRTIEFRYRGSGVFEGIAEYHEGNVWFEVSLNPYTPSIGEGSYNYITFRKPFNVINNQILYKHTPRPLQELDFGRYSISRYQLNINYVILHHKNTAPSAASEGYEVLVNHNIYRSSLRKIRQAIDSQRQLKIRLSNSHDYASHEEFILISPYQIGIELASGDTVVYGIVTRSMIGVVGESTFSIPFISTIEITKNKFLKEKNHGLSSDKFKIEYSIA